MAMASSTSSSSTFSFLNQLDAHLAATSSSSSSTTSNPKRLASTASTTLNQIRPFRTSSTPAVKRSRDKAPQKKNVESDSDDDIPLPSLKKKGKAKDNIKYIFNHDSDSDIEEISAPLPTKSSNAKGKGKAKEVPTSNLELEDEVDERRPDYDSWTLTKLQKEAALHGLKKLRSKPKVVQQLTEFREGIWREAAATSKSKSKTKFNLILEDQSSDRSESDVNRGTFGGSDEEMGDLTATLLREARSDEDHQDGDLTLQLLREAEEGSENERINEEEEEEDGDDEEEEIEEMSTSTLPFSVSSHLQKSILKDEQLYKRILLFEPIALDEIMSVARKNQVKVKDRIQVRSWLDEMGITNYSEDLSGSRSRH